LAWGDGATLGEIVLGDWASYLVYLVFSAAVAGSLLAGSLLWSRAFHRNLRTGRQKSRVFESGVSAGDFKPSNFSVNYYLTAMLFIVFDIEIVFLYPIAVNLKMLGQFGFIELLVFVAILAVGYVYVWRKGALEWH
jgi:NADH-quinone oxidoreductase subunit A